MDKNSNGIKKFLYDFKTFRPLLFNLAAKDFKLKYRRSVLGVLWSILNPLLTMLVITCVFGILLRVQVDNFATYYLVGASMWTFFSESTSLAMSSVIAGAPLIKKVYIPKYIFPLEKCLFSLINFAFSLIAVIAVMLIQGVYPTFAALLGLVPIFCCFVFSVGFSLILSALTVYFRDVMHLYGVLLTVWMYLTPIIYPMNIFDNITGRMASTAGVVRQIIQYNPLYHFVEYFRACMMHGSNPEVYAIPGIRETLVCLAFAFGALIIGSLIFKKAEKKFILHI